ncbi:MAG: HAMP domain-containing sensor histidine kinase [Acidobacteriaceae bacterium]
MTLRPRSLYTKIFLWFCVTIVASTVLVLMVAAVTGTQPFGRRWMAMTQDLYANSAVDFYRSGGSAGLTKYLQTIERESGIEGHLINAQGEDVLGGDVPEHVRGVYARALRTGQSAAHLGRYWTAASVTDSPEHFVFVMEAHPRRGFLDGTFFNPMAARLLGGVLLVAIFCLLLARHITQPIRMLEGAATRMASGDLSVRTLPALRGRTDELAAMAAAFDSMAERIEALLRTQREMLADISHELRSPLTRISVSLELLRRGEVDVLEPMQADLDRLNVMIGQVLELTRLELSEPMQVSEQHEVDLREILEEITESANYEGRATQKTVTLQTSRVVELAPGRLVTLPSAGPCMVLGEDSALRSCVENIVRNALEYSPAGGLIEIAMTAGPGEMVSVRVEDSGPGVPEEALARLFAPFYRVPGSAVGHPSGSGLGLSISARVAARCGGSIAAENRVPHGLSVRVELPRATPLVRAVS